MCLPKQQISLIFTLGIRFALDLKNATAGYQSAVWKADPPRVLHLRVLHKPDRDDVADHCGNSRAQQVGTDKTHC